MNFFQRAIKNVTRKLSKSILLLLTFFVIGNFVIVGLGVSQASENAKTMTRQKMRAVVSYEVDYDAINEYVNSLTDQDEIDDFYAKGYPNVKVSDIQNLLSDDRVLTANALFTSQFYAYEGDDFVHLGNQVEESLDDQQSCYIDESGNEVCQTYSQPSYFVKANYYPNMIEFQEGSYKVVDGSFYTQSDIDGANNVALVSKALAETNGWRVGDTINVYLTDPNQLTNDNAYYSGMNITEDDITLELEIIGIYSHNQAITPNSENFDWTYPYENPDNMILMPATTIAAKNLKMQQIAWDYYKEIYPDDQYYSNPDNYPTLENSSYIGNVTILLDDPLNVDAFVDEYSKDLPQFMMITANNEEFERLSKPLDTISLFANFIVWLVIVNAVVIITLVTALTLKTREYEIGVLLSIGASKLKIIGQFFVELAIVAIIGFTLSIATGSLVAGKIGETVLDYQITTSGVAEQDDYYIGTYTSIWDTDYATDVTLDDLVDEYNVSISPLIIAEIYVVGLGIVLVSILIPSMMIMRFNPKKILMNQN